ncbi:integrase [Prauserella flavalba]|uniref:Integrase n=2 Tax=Prauserella TaxID=142577 RepID=A0A318L9D3_9PSEU|nr:integrase [Prauserella flavalba]
MHDYQHLLTRHRVGPLDRLPAHEILAQLPETPAWSSLRRNRRLEAIRGASTVLDWLHTHDGGGWQDRWVNSGADNNTAWIATLGLQDTRATDTKRAEHLRGLTMLLLCRAVLPSYDFLLSYHSTRLLDRVREFMRPDVFTRVERAAIERGLSSHQTRETLGALSKIVLHTGQEIDQLSADDLLEAHVWSLRIRVGFGKFPGLHAAWDLLAAIGVLPAGSSLSSVGLRRGPRPTAELVDDYGVVCRPVRDLLVRYLDERRPALDYSTFRGLVAILVERFWGDIERHHPGIETLQLPDDVAREWKNRLRTVTGADGTIRERKNFHQILMRIRAFYLDIQQWALEDARWAPWAVPSPVRRIEIQGLNKAHKRTQAAMHQRVRQRLPHLPLLVDTADRCRAEMTALLAAAERCRPGQVFDHAGVRYRRVAPKTAKQGQPWQQRNYATQVENLVSGEVFNVTQREDEFFWAWAVIETLRHTGVRLEELLEITHLALVSYRLADSGEVVPLLQIVPSKGNEERLLLVSPELASVLATMISRLRRANHDKVPLVRRYDAHERVTGPALPHLFQRRTGTRNGVISPATLHKLINLVLAASGLTDAADEPLAYTPHDFRKIFTSEAVASGLPVHIAARLLGHHHISTTESYLAVFQEDLIRSYRAFLDKRRAVRPPEEYREPTDQEWQEFQQHFQLRKVALGDCGRPYGSSCQHEHSCVRCPMLRVSPTQRPRLIEIIHNLNARINEAKMNNWLGEAEGLQTSLTKATEKLVSLDRAIDRAHSTTTKQGTTDLGMPVINPR